MSIYIKVKPNSSKNEIRKLDESHWEVFVHKPAHGNEANLAVIDLIADELGISKSRIYIVGGSKSKYKTIEILGS